MGVLKQMLIDKRDELGEDMEGLSDQDIIDRMVDEYMQSEAYKKEHDIQSQLVSKNIKNNFQHPSGTS